MKLSRVNCRPPTLGAGRFESFRTTVTDIGANLWMPHGGRGSLQWNCQHFGYLGYVYDVGKLRRLKRSVQGFGKAAAVRRAMRANVWRMDEVRGSLERLLTAAEEMGPQEIVDGSRRFLVTALPTTKRRSAKEFLAKGGPLPRDSED